MCNKCDNHGTRFLFDSVDGGFIEANCTCVNGKVRAKAQDATLGEQLHRLSKLGVETQALRSIRW